MDMSKVLRWFTMIIAFMISLPTNGRCALFMNGRFERVSTEEYLLEFSETVQNVRTRIQCAWSCLKKKEDPQACVAFWFNPLDKSCDFYIKGTQGSQLAVAEVYLFEVTDVFQTISVDNELFSVYMSSGKTNYNGARVACNDAGGYLLQFESLKEYDALNAVVSAQFIIQGGYFVGANDMVNEGEWVYDRDGSQVKAYVILWNPGEAASYTPGENCMVYSTNKKKLFDAPCHMKKQFVCERDL